MTIIDKIFIIFFIIANISITIFEVIKRRKQNKRIIEEWRRIRNVREQENMTAQTLEYFKNLYLQNKEEIDRVAKEYEEMYKAGDTDA